MDAKVVDASVLAALLFAEPRAAEVREQLTGGTLYAPTLLFYELVSIAREKTIQQPEDGDTIAQALHLGFALDITLLEPDHHSVLALAITTGLSTYDASYLQTALSLRVPLATFDDRLAAVYRQIRP